MKKILVIRLSAMGDIVHAFPAISDIRRRWPDARIDVAVDERFADLVAMHCGVNEVIALPLKAWKKQRAGAGLFRAIWQKISQLRTEHYDVILDLHGVIKSAAVACLARGKLRTGPEWGHCAEKLAWLAYGRHLSAAQGMAPVTRMRCFAAQALDTDTAQSLDFGLAAEQSGVRERRVALLHASSCDVKLWPEAHWIALALKLRSQGYAVVLPWGSQAEQARAERIAAESGAEVGPSLSVAQWATELRRMALVVGVDTGLTHLAAAMGVPCLAIFTATGPELFMPQDPASARTLGRPGYPPSLPDVCHFADFLLGESQEEPVLAHPRSRRIPLGSTRKIRVQLGLPSLKNPT